MNSLRKSLFRKRRKNETSFRYLMWLLHLWLGLAAALIVFIMCLTGCLYSFKNQITEVVNQDKVFVNAPIAAPKLTLERIEKELLLRDKTLTSVIIPEGRSRSYVVGYKDGSTNRTAFLNPYTGEDLGTADTRSNRFFEVVLDIHRTLMLGEAGRQILGAGVLIFVFLLFSGFVLWFPKKLKFLKQGLTVKWNSRFKRLNYDFHNTFGFYTLLPLFFMAVTGLYVTYPWVKNALIVSLGGQSVARVTAADNTETNNAFNDLFNEMLARQNEKKSPRAEQKLPLDEILKRTNQLLPYSAVTSIELPNEENPRYTVRKVNTQNFLGMMLPDEVTFDREGNFKTKDLFADKPLNKQFTALVKPLHTGEIMGLPSIIIYFIFCLIGCSLPITGFLIWLHRYRK